MPEEAVRANLMLIYTLAGVDLAAVAWQDVQTHTIPDWAVALLLACGGVRGIQCNELAAAIGGLLLCGLPVLLISVWWQHGFIGGGDVKLCGALGFLLGPIGGYMVILMALIGLCGFGLLQRCRGSVEPIPFGPFIFAAYLIYFIFL